MTQGKGEGSGPGQPCPHAGLSRRLQPFCPGRRVNSAGSFHCKRRVGLFLSPTPALGWARPAGPCRSRPRHRPGTAREADRPAAEPGGAESRDHAVRGPLGRPARHRGDAADGGAGEGRASPGRAAAGKGRAGLCGPRACSAIAPSAETPPPCETGTNGGHKEQSPAPGALLSCARLAWPCLLQRDPAEPLPGARGTSPSASYKIRTLCIGLGFGFLLFAWEEEIVCFFEGVKRGISKKASLLLLLFLNTEFSSRRSQLQILILLTVP